MAGTSAAPRGAPRWRRGAARAALVRAPRLDELCVDFEDIIVALTDAEAEFVLVGSHAVAFHCASRSTTDLDLLIRPGWSNAAAVVSALRACGAPVDPERLRIDNVARFGVAYDLVAPPRHVDLLTEISGIDFDQAWRTSAPARVRSRRICVLGREALVRNKRATGRLKDLVDADRLERESAHGAMRGLSHPLA